jgi:ATP-binding cassette subfamily B protein
MKHLQYLNKYFIKYKWRFLAGILFVGLANLFKVWQPQVIREAIDTVVVHVAEYRGDGGLGAHPEASGALGWVIAKFGLSVIGLALTMGLFMYFMRQTIIVMSRLIEYDLRKEIYNHYQTLDTAFYKRNSTGDLMSRISEDVSKVRMYLGPTVLYGIDLVFLFVLTIYSMLQVSVELTLWSLLPLPFLSASIYWVSSLINKRSTKIQQQLSELTSIAQEVYSGIRVVKSYAREQPMSDWFADKSEDYRKKSLSLILVDAFFFPLMSLLIGASIIITVYVGGLHVVQGNITAGNIAEFVIYINMLTWPVTAIGWIASLTQQASVSQRRINEFLETKSEIKGGSGLTQKIAGHIVFDHVSFVYPDTGIRALDDVSFELLPGQKMGVVGKTGSGKTTIAELLVRMYDVTAGRILIDGVDIREYDVQGLRNRIGYIPQDVFLFSDTVLGNIAFGTGELNEHEAILNAKAASIHDEIKELPNGYHTIVGERGVTLSGGQKQRISIARAFSKNPDMIIMDDCLSAVDSTTEKNVLDHLYGALQGKTSIIITHRIFGMLDFDSILVLDNHKIEAIGNHATLLAQGGYYAELYDNQVTLGEIH